MTGRLGGKPHEGWIGGVAYGEDRLVGDIITVLQDLYGCHVDDGQDCSECSRNKARNKELKLQRRQKTAGHQKNMESAVQQWAALPWETMSVLHEKYLNRGWRVMCQRCCYGSLRGEGS